MRASEIVQVGPPATVIAATVYGFTLQDWASIAAIVLILLQIAYFVWEKIIKPIRTKREIRKADQARKRAQDAS